MPKLAPIRILVIYSDTMTEVIVNEDGLHVLHDLLKRLLGTEKIVGVAMNVRVDEPCPITLTKEQRNAAH